MPLAFQLTKPPAEAGGLVSTYSSPEPRLLGDRGSKVTAAPLATSISGPILEQTTGSRADIASSTGRPKPSKMLGTKRAQERRQRSAISRRFRWRSTRCTRLPTPRRSSAPRRRPRSGEARPPASGEFHRHGGQRREVLATRVQSDDPGWDDAEQGGNARGDVGAVSHDAAASPHGARPEGF